MGEHTIGRPVLAIGAGITVVLIGLNATAVLQVLGLT